MTSHTIDTVVIGAGHAGLAVSRLLTGAGREHVVLDRGRVGERWRTERWDSLHLLTPNWMTRLPGWYYGGPDAEGYLGVAQLIRLLERYAASFDAPVVSGTTVERLEPGPDDDTHRYRVVTDAGTWLTRHVVIATGPHGTPYLPPGLDVTAAEVLPANRYRNPDRLAPGGVLVVGASSSGVQIADELNRAGRDVVLSVGRHTRMPRRYRGMDIFWWLENTGRLARTIDQVPDAQAARHEPSMQLVGRNDPAGHAADLDLAVLQRNGVRLAGRFEGVAGGTARFRDDLADQVADADRRMNRFLDAVDGYVAQVGLSSEVWDGVRPGPVRPAATTRVDLRTERIGTVLLAAGYRPDHGWLRLPVTAPDGTIRQVRGVTAAPGVYVVGQRFQHRRDSGFIDGARHDAHAVVRHLVSGGRPARAARSRLGEPVGQPGPGDHREESAA
jgi:putative flavoprotein involved in K+ transport